MDNQHVQVDSHELAWLAGCIECDGSISIGYHNSSKTGIRPQCSITFCNTGMVMFNRVKAIWDGLGVQGYVRQLTPRANRPQCKPVYQIEAVSQTKCKKLLEAIYPWLMYKKPQADIMLEFIASRMQHFRQKGVPHSKRELQLIYNMRVLNHKGTSQTEDRELVAAIAAAR